MVRHRGLRTSCHCSSSFAQRRRLVDQHDFEVRVLAADSPGKANPVEVQAKLCRRIAKHLPALFVVVADPACLRPRTAPTAVCDISSPATKMTLA
jgi:hypothetical protein